MTRFVIGRVLQALLVVVLAVTVVFVLGRIAGDPTTLLLPPSATPADVERLKESLGLNQPLPIQYADYLRNIGEGDFGRSYSYEAPVSKLIMDALPYTAILAFAAFTFALVGGVCLGVFAAFRAGSAADTATSTVSLLGQSVPAFWLGILLVFALSVHVHLFPPFGSGGVEHLVLPAIALGALPLASISRLTRSSVLEALHTDHAMFERSKGVPPSVFIRHVLRNAALPVVTLSGIILGHLLSGAIVVETLFGWPGMGQLAIQAMTSSDYNVVQGVVIVATVIFVVLNLLVDLSYGLLDPRVRRVASESSNRDV